MKKQVEETTFDSSLKKLNADILWNKMRNQELKKSILTDIEESQLPDGNKDPMLVTRVNNTSLSRKLVYSCAALIVLFALFVGSAFISPAMAEIVSKIPYLNKVFQSEPVTSIIFEKLEEKGYKVNGVGSNAHHIKIRINGSEQYFQDVREDVKETAEKILKSRGYDAYTIKVTKDVEKKIPPVSEREQALEESLAAIYKELRTLQFQVLSHGYSYPSPNSKKVIIHFDVPNTEKRIEEIKDISNKSLMKNNLDSYSIKINTIDLEQKEKEAKWHRIFPAIYEGLSAKKEYKVTGFAFSFHPEPLQIIIKTSINKSDKDAAEKVHLIERTIIEFLQSQEIKSKIEGEPYELIIRSKDKRRLN